MIQNLPLLIALHSDWAILLLRLVAGGIMIDRGLRADHSQKGSGILLVLMVVCGIALVLGVFVRVGAVLSASWLMVAIIRNFVQGVPARELLALDLLLLAAMVVLFGEGSGALAFRDILRMVFS